jgi:hypothetical protein
MKAAEVELEPIFAGGMGSHAALTAWPEKQNEKSAAEVGSPRQLAAGIFEAFGKPVIEAAEPTRAMRRRDCDGVITCARLRVGSTRFNSDHAVHTRELFVIKVGMKFSLTANIPSTDR